MQPIIRTFRAPSLDEAMNLVRQELGPDAVVVDAKEIGWRRLLPWSSTPAEVEVKAECENTSGHSEQANMPSKPASRIVRSLAEGQTGIHSKRELFSSTPGLAADIVKEEIPVQSAFRSVHQINDAITQLANGRGRSSEENEQVTVGYRQNLEALQNIVAKLERQSRPREVDDVPGELFQQYCQLLDADVDTTAARELIANLRRHLPHDCANSPAVVTTTLTALIEREMRCAPPISPKPGRREIVTLIGTTGVGKTTTLAKLAGHFHLREGLRVGLITVDHYRVGAIEQLQTYANILQIPLRTASNPDELRIAIDGLDNVDLILIDTAGRSPLDSQKLNELKNIIHAADSDHVLLVMSLGFPLKVLCDIAKKFACASPTSLVLTKADEITDHGGLLSIAREIPHPVCYVTTGQDVPDDIEPAHPHLLAKMILGQDQIQSGASDKSPLLEGRSSCSASR